MINIIELANKINIPVEQLETALAVCQKEKGAKYGYGYKTVFIPKRNGKKRRLDIPGNRLKRIQQALLPILAKFPVSEASVGFTKDKSAAIVAKVFTGWNTIIALDLKDFFPSTSAKQWQRYLINSGMSEEVAKAITRLTTFRGGLPQGAPTSPVISNILAKNLDEDILQILYKWEEPIISVYKRYADDLIIGLNITDNKTISNILLKLKRSVELNGYKLNTQKTKVMKKPDRQIVLGITVSTEEPTMDFRLYRETRAAVNNFIRHGMLPMKGVTPEVQLEKMQNMWYRISGIKDIPVPPRPYSAPIQHFLEYKTLPYKNKETINRNTFISAMTGWSLLKSSAAAISKVSGVIEQLKDSAYSDALAQTTPYIIDMMRAAYQYTKERNTPWKRERFNKEVEDKIYAQQDIDSIEQIAAEIEFEVDSVIHDATLKSTTIALGHAIKPSEYKAIQGRRTITSIHVWYQYLAKYLKDVTRNKTFRDDDFYVLWKNLTSLEQGKKAILHPLLVLPQYYPVLLCSTITLITETNLSVSDKALAIINIVHAYKDLMTSIKRGLQGKVNWINQINTKQGDALVAMLKNITKYDVTKTKYGFYLTVI